MQKHTPVIVSERSAFTLIEMIGVLAIMSILAAMIAPNVIKSIRESKISSAIASVNAAQIAATHYYQRYERIPADTEIVESLYHHLPTDMRGAAGRSVLAHLEHMVETERARLIFNGEKNGRFIRI